MTGGQTAITVAIMAAATMLTRFLPFIMFPEGKKVPSIVSYLGRSLPYAAIGMLVVYCLKDVVIKPLIGSMPEIISVVLVILIHSWRKNTILSVLCGTACYMIVMKLLV